MTTDILAKLVTLIDWAFVIVVVAFVLFLLAGICIISARDDQADEDRYGVDKARRS